MRLTNMRSVSLACLPLLIAGCSALINPDTDRIGGDVDAGPGGGFDAGRGRVDAGPGGGGCDPGMTRCDGVCVSTATDPDHCGRCGNACGDFQICQMATCRCPAGDPNCSPLGDPNDCGPAGVECPPDRWCVDGQCRCRPGFTQVGERCVDLSSDPENCGSPGHVCPDGVCAGGECRDACPPNTRRCGDQCLYVFDPRNCGECGRACQADEVCIRGDCRQYDVATCRMCPCPSCGEQACCGVGDLGAICVDGERCPGG